MIFGAWFTNLLLVKRRPSTLNFHPRHLKHFQGTSQAVLLLILLPSFGNGNLIHTDCLVAKDVAMTRRRDLRYFYFIKCLCVLHNKSHLWSFGIAAVWNNASCLGKAKSRERMKMLSEWFSWESRLLTFNWSIVVFDLLECSRCSQVLKGWKFS